MRSHTVWLLEQAAGHELGPSQPAVPGELAGAPAVQARAPSICSQTEPNQYKVATTLNVAGMLRRSAVLAKPAGVYLLGISVDASHYQTLHVRNFSSFCARHGWRCGDIRIEYGAHRQDRKFLWLAKVVISSHVHPVKIISAVTEPVSSSLGGQSPCSRVADAPF